MEYLFMGDLTMRMLARLVVTVILFAFPVLSASAQKALDRTKPHYQIFVIDVSPSMLCPFDPTDTKKLVPPSDPDGVRWDGVQFAIDISPPNDRVALVLFSANAIVLTKLVDASEGGFIQLNKVYQGIGAGNETMTGRQVLRLLIEELQKAERVEVAKNIKVKERLKVKAWEDLPWAAYEKLDYLREYKSKGLAKNRHVKFTMGTSVVKALEALEEDDAKLLKAIPAESPAWIFVLTDGREESQIEDFQRADNLKDGLPGYRPDHAEYVKYREKLKIERKRGPKALDDLVSTWVQGLQDKHNGRIPIVAFALGEHCDNELLRSLADTSNPIGFRGPGQDNKVKIGNLEMLSKLQTIVWGVRQYCARSAPPSTARRIFSGFRP